MTALTVVYVDHEGSDWLAIYDAAGARIYEGHPPNAEDAFDAAGIDVDVRTFPSARLGDLRRMRGMPSRVPA